ncbi:2-oxo-4-hydroxy-4-carboxy-5-ureidoimidazoline decarboxylase [Halioxenophilus aromaticivorans]|uniref:2-oxo-4-hydroxy-4-carboxy-5-ureidoimidazoline decarboxylase n=1 Tax=Halioxenophilus aromaticivorans TaxID=1306992 RepID=A0AAV3TZ80_9ALTE
MSNASAENTTLTLAQLNALTGEQACAFFLSICHCQRWAQDMDSARPYATVPSLLGAAADYWQNPTEEEILESFTGHARIGDLSAMEKKYSAAAKEQGQVASASRAVIEQLFEDNNRYFEKNGFIFVVCASGKSAREMLGLLQQRLSNSRGQELATGAAEQAKISELRLSQRVI